VSLQSYQTGQIRCPKPVENQYLTKDVSVSISNNKQVMQLGLASVLQYQKTLIVVSHKGFNDY
jgi:hypothetical protein